MNIETVEAEINKKNYKHWHIDDFDSEKNIDLITGDMPRIDDFNLQRLKIRKDVNKVSPELKEFFCEPLLDSEQEQHMFRRYNYYKYKCYQNYQNYKVSLSDADESKCLEFSSLALEDRNLIVCCNTRLAAKIIKKRKDYYGDNLSDLMSDCFYNIVKAVDGFDFRRGYKFSTYCIWVLMNNTLREHGQDKKFYDNFCTNIDSSIFSGKIDENDFGTNDSLEKNEGIDSDISKVLNLVKSKGEREYFVLVNCFGLNGQSKKTLKQISEDLNLTKERVRQIRESTIKYVKKLAQQGGLNLSAANF